MRIHALLGALAMTLTLAVPGLAYAQGPGAHGGPMANAGPYHVELTVAGDELLLYVTDVANHPVAVAGAVAEATVVIERRTRKVVLSPTGANILSGRWSAAGAPGGLEAVVALTLPGKEPVTAKFEAPH